MDGNFDFACNIIVQVYKQSVITKYLVKSWSRKSAKEKNVPPNGECGLQMKQRVLEAFSEIKEDTVVICHGGVIAAIMEHLFPEENKTRYDWQPKNGCGYMIKDHGYQCIP